MSKLQILFFAVVGAEILIIAFLGLGVVQDLRLLADVSVNAIGVGTITFAREDSAYAHFYEPKSSQLLRVSPASCCPRYDWLQDEVVYTINSDGLNDRFEYSLEKPADVFRIVSLGDSYTYGSNVSTERNYSELLEDMLNERLPCAGATTFEVLNLGVPGYDLAYAVERFRLRGAEYSPDLVLWSVKSGNFVNNIAELQLEQADRKVQEARQEGREPTPEELLAFNEEAVYEAQDIVRSKGKEWMSSYVRDVLAKMADLHAGKLMLFSASVWQWNEDSLSLVGEFVRSRPATSFWRMTSELPPDALLPDYHPSEKGHRIIAEELFSSLVQEKAVPCGVSQ